MHTHNKKLVVALFATASLTQISCSEIHSNHNNNAKNSVTDTCPSHYQNPIIWQDLPDPEVIRVDDTYYYTASSFHQSPGAPLLRSYDLVHWEYLSHSVPVLDYNSSYDLVDGRAYVDGIWASTLAYRKSNQQFYWMGCMHDTNEGYMYTASNPAGPWQKHQTEACYYDMGLLIEQDTDNMYVASGNGTISVAQLSADGTKEIRRQVVFETPKSLSGPLEGARFYKIDGDYYIWLTQYANGEYVARSRNGPFGPYEIKPLAVNVPFEDIGAGHSPHQGGIVQTQQGDWYYIAFNDAFPAGRLPVMAPITWQDGWPVVDLPDGKWATEYPFPNINCGKTKVASSPNIDLFKAKTLNPQWEWNHNPDNSRWSSGNGLVLKTTTITDDFYAARNTLTRRIEGPISSAVAEVDITNMQAGDVAGLALFRDRSAWLGIKKNQEQATLMMRSQINLNKQWQTQSLGETIELVPVNTNKLWLKVVANVSTSKGGGYGSFYYSVDGDNYKAIGDQFLMTRNWQYFQGYRFALFNYAEEKLGGEVRILSFETKVNRAVK